MVLPRRAVRSGDWKLALDGPIEMVFDVRKDPGEHTDLTNQQSQVTDTRALI